MALMKMSRALVLVVPFLLGLLHVTGCDTESYSESVTYRVRTDPIILGDRFDVVGPDYPDRPGVLPVSSFKDLTQPDNPLHRFADRKDAIFNPADLDSEDRDGFVSTLEDL